MVVTSLGVGSFIVPPASSSRLSRVTCKYIPQHCKHDIVCLAVQRDPVNSVLISLHSAHYSSHSSVHSPHSSATFHPTRSEIIGCNPCVGMICTTTMVLLSSLNTGCKDFLINLSMKCLSGDENARIPTRLKYAGKSQAYFAM